MESTTKLTNDKKDGKKGGGGDVDHKRAVSAMTHQSTMERYRKATMSDLMETFRRMRGVVAVMMMNNEGMLGKSNFDKVTSGMYCGLANQILKKTIPLIQRLSSSNKLRTIRSNGGGQELLISPVENHDLIFVIVQNCTDRESIASNCLKPENKSKQHGKRRMTESSMIPTTTDMVPPSSQQHRGSASVPTSRRQSSIALKSPT